MKLSRVLRQFLFQSAIWTIICVLCEAVCKFWLHLDYPYTYPAISRGSMFCDFILWRDRFVNFHSPGFFTNHWLPLMYPAPVAVLYKIFFLTPFGPESDHALIARFVSVILISSWIIGFTVRDALIRRGLAPRSATIFALLTYLLSFPFWFDVHQGNMEFLILSLVVLGIWSFWTGRPWIAAAVFGIAASMKIFPFVFLGLLVARKQYRQTCFALLVAGVTTITSLWLVCPNIKYSWQQTNLAIAQFREIYILHLPAQETGFDHSLFGLVKRAFPVLPAPQSLGHVLNLYLAVVATAGCICFFARIRKLPLINQILCLSIAAILLPPTSYEYTLLELYPGLVLLAFVAIQPLTSSSPQSQQRGLRISFMLLAFLLSVQSEFLYHGLRFGGQIQCIALLLLWIVAMVFPFDLEKQPYAVSKIG